MLASDGRVRHFRLDRPAVTINRRDERMLQLLLVVNDTLAAHPQVPAIAIILRIFFLFSSNYCFFFSFPKIHNRIVFSLL